MNITVGTLTCFGKIWIRTLFLVTANVARQCFSSFFGKSLKTYGSFDNAQVCFFYLGTCLQASSKNQTALGCCYEEKKSRDIGPIFRVPSRYINYVKTKLGQMSRDERSCKSSTKQYSPAHLGMSICAVFSEARFPHVYGTGLTRLRNETGFLIQMDCADSNMYITRM